MNYDMRDTSKISSFLYTMKHTPAEQVPAYTTSFDVRVERSYIHAKQSR